MGGVVSPQCNVQTLSDAFEIRVEGGETFLEALTALCKVGDGLFAEAPASSVPSEWSYDGVHATDLREVEAMATCVLLLIFPSPFLFEGGVFHPVETLRE